MQIESEASGPTAPRGGPFFPIFSLRVSTFGHLDLQHLSDLSSSKSQAHFVGVEVCEFLTLVTRE
jgi:hypothetical protein